MPFDPRTKSRKTTTLPAALREELGLPAPSAQRRPFRPHDRRFNSQPGGSGKPQLKAIGRPQSAVNGAAKGTPRGPIKTLRNQEKEQQQQQQQARTQPHHKHTNNNASAKAGSASASSSRASSSQSAKGKEAQKRKPEKQPEQALKVIKKPKSTASPKVEPEAEPVERKTRLNPFTGELEVVQPTKKKASSKPKQTALEKMLARAEAGPSSSKGKAKAGDGLGGGKKKNRKHMSQQEKEEEDEIRWLEYSLGKSRQGEDVVRDDLDDFLDDLDRFQVGMYDESDSEEDESDADESDDSGLEEVSASSEEEQEDSGESEEESESEESGNDAESASDEEDEDDGLDEEGTYDFDSNDEDDFSNWDAAMATTDEEDQDGDDQDDESESSEGEEDDNGDSEAEEARALIAGCTTASAPSSTDPPAPATTAATKYIPPALRAKLAAESSSTTAASATATVNPSSGPGVSEVEMDPLSAQKLRRQAQGLLNRLGDGNIDTILTEYETLYRTHARAHVTSIVTQLILDTITSRSNLIDTFVILHAALVAALHKVVGVEFAAFFIQRLVEELVKHYEALKASAGAERRDDEDEEGKGKECLNLTVLACELYNLHVVACPLIYDLIRMFLGEPSSSSDTDAVAKGNITEVDIELLLKTIRSCGHQLRSDDPTSLKAIITLTQSRVASSASSTRTKFMLERMTDLQKNAKSSKGGANDASNPSSPSGQLLTRMKKYLGGMAKKRTVKSYEALRIGLKDLRDADKKGKWWLVGAAWTGQTDQTDAQGLTKLLPMSARASAIQSSANSFSTPAAQQEDEQQHALLELARAQGMNTDARRTVFITLLTAEDYKQAAENVLLLKLNDVQRREVIRVLVHCVGSEAVYNPYYTLIGHEICRNDHGMRITLQYCLWDFLREIGQNQVGGEKFAAALFTSGDDGDSTGEGKKVDPRRVANMARAYAWWLTHDCLSLQSLKTVDFTLLNPRPSQFLGLLLIHLVLSIQSSSPAKTLHLPTVTKPLKEDKITRFLQSNLLGGSVDLSRGLLFFLNAKLDARAQKKLVLGEERADKALKSQMQPLLHTVKNGLGCMLRTVQAIVQQLDGVGEGVDDVDMNASDSDDDVQDDY